MKYVEGLINNMKVIQKILPPSPLRLLGSGSRQQALSRPGSSSGGASLLLKKRLTPTFLVLLVVLAAGLLFLLPGGLLQAQQDNMTTVNYAENGEGSVVDLLSATDPEGDTPITWDVPSDASAGEGIDADADAYASHIDISKDGVLTFDIGGDGDPDDNVSPDFEAPWRVASPNADELNTLNTYEVIVTASDPSVAYWTTFNVNVKVTRRRRDEGRSPGTGTPTRTTVV